MSEDNKAETKEFPIGTILSLYTGESDIGKKIDAAKQVPDDGKVRVPYCGDLELLRHIVGDGGKPLTSYDVKEYSKIKAVRDCLERQFPELLNGFDRMNINLEQPVPVERMNIKEQQGLTAYRKEISKAMSSRLDQLVKNRSNARTEETPKFR